MRLFTTLLTRAALVALVAFVTIEVGCQNRRSQPTASNQAQVEKDIHALLDRWVRAFEARDLIAVRSVLSTDHHFVWLEDGEARYQSVDSVVTALAGFPPGLTFSHEMQVLRIVPISDDAAWAQLATKTKIRQGEKVVSGFDGVVLMLVQRNQGGWRIAAAHTSTAKPRTQSPG